MAKKTPQNPDKAASRDEKQRRRAIADEAESKLKEKAREEALQRRDDLRAAKASAKAARASAPSADRTTTTADVAIQRRTSIARQNGKNGHSAVSVAKLAAVRPKGPVDPDPQAWAKHVGIKDTRQVEVPELLIDQVLGQEDAVALARKAAEQKRHLLLIGDPGTGKSMLAKALAAILPDSDQDDVIVYHNQNNPNNPKVTAIPGGTGRELVHRYEKKATKALLWWKIMEWLIALGAIGVGVWLVWFENESLMVLLFIVLLAMAFLFISSSKRPKSELIVPKLLIQKPGRRGPAPYVDATGSHAGALLGDVRHDPYQAGGLETPPHQRVEVGGIHRAHRGVLFIDEINTLKLGSQQNLLTALQERKYAIAGQSQSSAGAMVKTEPMPCDFILVAAGNLDAVMTPEESLSGETGMHPALRSRLRGYGYEVFVNSEMDDTHENRVKMLQFVAQEVERDGKIPHFTIEAAAEIIRESQRRSGEAGKLTLRLRELGGLVRTAGDVAISANADTVTRQHVLDAKRNSRSLEQQMAENQIRKKLAEVAVDAEGLEVGSANGGASVGTGEVGEPAGLIVPVEASVVASHSHSTGSITLGAGIAAVDHSGVQSVGAVLKRLAGPDLKGHEVHIDATIPHPEADVAGIGIAAAVAAISALDDVPVRQDTLLIGGVAIKGQLRAAKNTLQIIEAAANVGFKRAVVPGRLRNTLLVDDHVAQRIEVVYCDTLVDVLEHVLEAPKVEIKAITGRMRATRRQKVSR